MPGNTATAATQPSAPEGAVPDWFARGRIARGVRDATEAEPTRQSSKTSDDGRPLRRFYLWAVGGSAAGYAVSVVVHSLILVACSLVVLQIGKGSGGGTIDTTIGVPDATGDEFLDTRSFQISNGSNGIDEAITVAEPLPLDAPSTDLAVASAFDPKPAGAPDGTGQDDKTVEGSGLGNDGAFELPAGGNAVRQGSFAAWTVPERPRVGQKYIIVIEVTLPAGTEKYARSDLSGQVAGTDNYKVMIPDGLELNGPQWTKPSRPPAFRRTGNKARFVFHILGAQKPLVRDTIFIRSWLLDEQQTLEIVF